MKQKLMTFSFLFTILFAANSQASTVKSCQFEAEVKATAYSYNVGLNSEIQPIAVLEMKSAEDKGSHFPHACQRDLDRDIKVININDDHHAKLLTKGARVVVKYDRVDNEGIDGEGSTTETTISITEPWN